MVKAAFNLIGQILDMTAKSFFINFEPAGRLVLFEKPGQERRKIFIAQAPVFYFDGVAGPDSERRNVNRFFVDQKMAVVY